MFRTEIDLTVLISYTEIFLTVLMFRTEIVLTVLISHTEIILTVLMFRTETVLTVLISRTEIVLTVLMFRTETVLTVLISRTEIVLTVLMLCTEIRYDVPCVEGTASLELSPSELLLTCEFPLEQIPGEAAGTCQLPCVALYEDADLRSMWYTYVVPGTAGFLLCLLQVSFICCRQSSECRFGPSEQTQKICC
jgi:hypothetical protein